MKNLGLLIPQATTSDVQTWATVTGLSPLRIKVDGDSAALPLTPDSLVAGLAVNDRVWIGLTTNDDDEFEAMRVVVLGKAGGYLVPHSHSDPALLTALNRRLALSTTHSADHNSTETVLFPTPDYNIGSFTYSTGTGKWQVPATAFYHVSVGAVWASAGGSGTLAEDLNVVVNGTSYPVSRNIIRNASEGGRPVYAAWEGLMTAGQDHWITSFQNANGGSALNVDLRVTIRCTGTT